MATLGPLAWVFGEDSTPVYTVNPTGPVYDYVYVLPTKTDGTWWYILNQTLDGKPYTLEFRWNERGSAWFVAISDADGQIAVSKVVCGVALFDYNNPRLPPGIFYVDRNAATPPGLLELGTTFLLMYVPSEVQ
jgi:hypothetical protein